jgi:hypothetical protein
MLGLIASLIAVLRVCIFFVHTVVALGQAAGRDWIN